MVTCEHGTPDDWFTRHVTLISSVQPFRSAMEEALREWGGTWYWFGKHPVPDYCWHSDIIIVAGWRHLLPPEILRHAKHGAVGFHSAKLPEYPGRAPVPWTLLRGDDYAYNTMFHLDEGVDSGDIIDSERYWIRPGDQPADLVRFMAESSARLLRKHLPALLAGTAPRTPQDPSKRGPLTTADGWKRHASLPRYTP